MPRRYFRKKTQEWVTYNYYKPTGKPRGPRAKTTTSIKHDIENLPAEKVSRIRRLLDRFHADLEKENTPPPVADPELDSLMEELANSK